MGKSRFFFFFFFFFSPFALDKFPNYRARTKFSAKLRRRIEELTNWSNSREKQKNKKNVGPVGKLANREFPSLVWPNNHHAELTSRMCIFCN